MINLGNSRLVDLLPPNLQTPHTRALSVALHRQTEKLADQIKLTLVLADVQSLREELCDRVADDFRIQAYDLTMDLGTKRRMIAIELFISSKRGTAVAVQKGIGSIYTDAETTEWFDYDGLPYCFRVRVDVSETGATMDTHAAVIQQIEFYKNVRSHLDEVAYLLKREAPIYILAYPSYGHKITINPYTQEHLEEENTISMAAVPSYGHMITVGER